MSTLVWLVVMPSGLRMAILDILLLAILTYALALRLRASRRRKGGALEDCNGSPGIH